MNHTPGPWEVYDEQDGGLALVIGHCLRVTVDHREDFGRAKPDARLIAAAPDLLEALKRTLPYLRDHIGMTPDEGPGDRMALDLAEEAIAKAEGNSD